LKIVHGYDVMDDFLLGDCQQVVLRFKYPLIDGILKTNSIG